MKRRPLKILAYTVAFLIIVAVATVAPVDRTPIAEQQFYHTMQLRLAGAGIEQADGEILTSWSRINITASHSMPMAGYAPRASFDSVHDSLFARILTVRAHDLTVSFIDVDLLLFPPALRDRLTEKMDSSETDNRLFLSATHTHNGTGGWDDSFVGSWSLGAFDKNWIETTANSLLAGLKTADLKPSVIRYWQSDASELVENRVDRENGKTDGILRGIEITRNDSSTALLYTFSAHPTSIESVSRELSADYPGAVTKNIETQFDFAMFMAGMVGSHRFVWTPQSNYEFIDYITPIVSGKIMARKVDSADVVPKLQFSSVPIEFGPAQLRITGNWKVRSWLFGSMLHPLKGNVVMAEIGNIVFIGLPCDFSGEIFSVDGLEEIARANGKHLIITSFNGDYDGYITLDRHYDVSHAEEIRALNWVGPGYGEYFSSIIKNVIERKD